MASKPGPARRFAAAYIRGGWRSVSDGARRCTKALWRHLFRLGDDDPVRGGPTRAYSRRAGSLECARSAGASANRASGTGAGSRLHRRQNERGAAVAPRSLMDLEIDASGFYLGVV
jgi:hypothetical protein